MRKSITTALLLFSLTLFAQKNFQGKAIYQSKTTIDMSGWGGRFSKMSEQQKKQMMDRMKSMLEKTFILNFNRSESLYKEEEKLAAPGQGRGFRFGGFSGGGTRYKNTTEGKMLEETEFFGKQFLITEDAEKPQWELGSETKQIGKYTAFKATMMKKTSSLDWSSMRRRNKDKKEETAKDSTKTVKISEDIEMPKEILVTAWYTPQVPVSSGPGEYWGLPGLILEVSSGTTTILCTEIVLNPTEKVEIKEPTKGEKVTRKEYTEIIQKKMQEMREMYRGRRGRGRRSPH